MLTIGHQAWSGVRRRGVAFASVRPVDPRLLRHAGAARGCLAVTVLLGLVITGLVLTQADLLARVLAGAARGSGGRALAGTLAALLVVPLARAAATAGGEAAARTWARLPGGRSPPTCSLSPAAGPSC